MNIKNTLFNLAVLGMGGAGGYFIAKKKLQEKYQEDLADVQDFYYKKLQELGVMDEDFEPEEMTDEEMLDEFKRVTNANPSEIYESDEIHDYPNNVMEMPEKGKDKTRTETSKDMKYDKGKGRPIISYNKPPLEKILADIEAEGDEEDIVNDLNAMAEDPDYEAEIEARAEEFVKRRYENQISGEPYCINYDEWQEAPEEYERQFLYYYGQDRVLCEDDDSIVDDEEIVGLDYEDVLSMQTTAWVRNDQICTLYEIHRIDGSYNDIVTNAIETPREREFRLVARRKEALDSRD